MHRHSLEGIYQSKDSHSEVDLIKVDQSKKLTGLQKKIIVESMSTFATDGKMDRRTDRGTDGADYIGPSVQ